MSQTNAPAFPEQFLRMPQVCQLIGWKRAMVYKAVAAGNFPRMVRLSPKSSAWRASEIAAWQAAKIAQRDAATAAG